MKREYRISEQPGGYVLVSECELDEQGRVLRGLWTETCANILSATYTVQAHEEKVALRRAKASGSDS